MTPNTQTTRRRFDQPCSGFFNRVRAAHLMRVTTRATWGLFFFTFALGVFFSSSQHLFAAEEISEKTAPIEKTKTAGDDLSIIQGRLADRFNRLEEVVGRLAELTADKDPHRAQVLRNLITESRDKDIPLQFSTIVRLLEQERLSSAGKNQKEIGVKLQQLYETLMKENRSKRLQSQRKRFRKYLKEVNRLIRMQQGIISRTEAGEETERLQKDQKYTAEKTGELLKKITDTEETTPKQENPKAGQPKDPQGGKNPSDAKPSDAKPSDAKPSDAKPSDAKPSDAKPSDAKPSDAKPSDAKPSDAKPSDGKPSDGKPSDAKPSDAKPSDAKPSDAKPSDDQQEASEQNAQKTPADRTTKQLKQALENMEQAEKELADAKRSGAKKQQEKALKKLQEARAELEKILRQLREEESERTLVQLIARFRKMRSSQLLIYDKTVRLEKRLAKHNNHENEIEAGRLSRAETALVRDTTKALLLLKEEGSSIAFPEAVEQMREDMRQVVTRLANVKASKITQGLEQDILDVLEEMISALEKELKKQQEKKTPPGESPPPGQPSDPPLVDMIAELKMIRSLQMRINRRTKRYHSMIEGLDAPTNDLYKALERLAERQSRIIHAAKDLIKKTKK